MRVWIPMGWLWLLAGLMPEVLAQSPDAEPPSAQEVMIRAHQARAQWEEFPGFEADVTFRSNGRRLVRRVIVTPQLRVQWSDPIPQEFLSLKRRFESVIQHRAASQDDHFDVEFVEEQGDHPLGRLIRFRNDPSNSRYRIRGDLIAQVMRDAGPLCFTISVLDVTRNAQGKYLPRIYTVSFWNRTRGHLVRSFTVKLSWVRVERWDLPLQIQSVSVEGNPPARAEVIRLQNHRLLGRTAASGAGASEPLK